MKPKSFPPLPVFKPPRPSCLLTHPISVPYSSKKKGRGGGLKKGSHKFCAIASSSSSVLSKEGRKKRGTLTTGKRESKKIPRGRPALDHFTFSPALTAHTFSGNGDPVSLSFSFRYERTRRKGENPAYSSHSCVIPLRRRERPFRENEG